MDPNPTPPRRWPTRLPVFLAIAAITAAVFAPTTTSGLINFDDPECITVNAAVRDGLTLDGVWWAFTQVWACNWIPLTWISFQLDVTVWGGDPRGFHVTNVALHAASAGLLYLVLLRLTGAPVRCAAVALLWALHPLRTESVAWVSERKDVLSVFFGLLGLWAYARYVESRSETWMAAVFGLFALGMMAKPGLITFPCCLLLLDAWPLNRLKRARDLGPLIREKAPLFILVVAFSLVTLFAQEGSRNSLEDHPASARARTALVGYVLYLGKTLWPEELAGYHPFPPNPRPPWQPVGAAVLLVALTAAAVALRRRAPYLLVGWLWFLGALFPTCGLFQTGHHEYAERYTYWPHIGLMVAGVFAVADLVARARALRWAALAGCAVLLVACAGVTREALPHWRDGVAFWTRITSVHPDSALGWRGLGEAALAEGDREAARAALKECLRLNPKESGARVMLGNLENPTGD
jgi:hypothetical protein